MGNHEKIPFFGADAFSFSALADEMGLVIPRHAAAQFACHAEMVVKANRAMNLTAITEPVQMAVKHYLDCAMISLYLPGTGLVLDIGSGAGFPAIPLKIISPDIRLTLMDASRKKVHFLQHVIRTLALSDTAAIHARAPDMRPALSGHYDAVICRAVAGIETILSMGLPFLKPDGLIVAMKGGDFASKEADGIQRISPDVTHHIHHYKLPLGYGARTIVILQKRS